MDSRAARVVSLVIAIVAASAGITGAQVSLLTETEQDELAAVGWADEALPTDGELVAVGSPDWGTQDYTFYAVPASSCVEVDNRAYGGGFGWYNGTSGAATTYDCEVPLPSGSLLYSFALEADDTDATHSVSFALRDCANLSITCTDVRTGATTGSPGKAWLGPYVGIDLTINNNSRFYFTRVSLGSGTSSTKFRRVALGVKLQVSPAPATATFADVPTGHMFFQYVEALADSGITAGCGGGNFCPDQPLTRGQMAVFLSKALGLHWSP